MHDLIVRTTERDFAPSGTSSDMASVTAMSRIAEHAFYGGLHWFAETCSRRVQVLVLNLGSRIVFLFMRQARTVTITGSLT